MIFLSSFDILVTLPARTIPAINARDYSHRIDSAMEREIAERLRSFGQFMETVIGLILGAVYLPWHWFNDCRRMLFA